MFDALSWECEAMHGLSRSNICNSGLTAVRELLARGFNVTATEGESAKSNAMSRAFAMLSWKASGEERS